MALNQRPLNSDGFGQLHLAAITVVKSWTTVYPREEEFVALRTSCREGQGDGSGNGEKTQILSEIH